MLEDVTEISDGLMIVQSENEAQRHGRILSVRGAIVRDGPPRTAESGWARATVSPKRRINASPIIRLSAVRVIEAG
jgi:hypothetical protein